MAETLRGADIVIRALEQQGVTHVFTLSGNHIMSLFDAALGRPIDHHVATTRPVIDDPDKAGRPPSHHNTRPHDRRP